jgi:hypothetical protein
LQAALAEVLGRVLKQGYFGTARIELGIQDGTIRQIRRITEQVER